MAVDRLLSEVGRSRLQNKDGSDHPLPPLVIDFRRSVLSQMRAIGSFPGVTPDTTSLSLTHAHVHAGQEHFFLLDGTLKDAFITPSTRALITDQQEAFVGFSLIAADFKAALWIPHAHRQREGNCVWRKAVTLRCHIRRYRLHAKERAVTRKIGAAIEADRLEASERLAA